MTAADHVTRQSLRLLIGLLRRLGPVRASNLGGALARAVGPLLPVSRIAHANLQAALPQLDGAARRRVVRQVWDNLGRTIAEMPVLDRLGPSASGPGWELVEHPEVAAADLTRGAIYVTGHLANWELMLAVSRAVHRNLAVLYRAPANGAVDRVVRDLRSAYGGPAMRQFRKGATGAKQTVQHLRQGGVLGLLADQKANDGIAVPFFGRDAMTAPAVAAMALKFRLPLIPSQVQRLGPARFRVILHPPLALPGSGNRHDDVAALTQAVNRCLEQWITERPGEWLWLHRRWPNPPAGPAQD